MKMLLTNVHTCRVKKCLRGWISEIFAKLWEHIYEESGNY